MCCVKEAASRLGRTCVHGFLPGMPEPASAMSLAAISCDVLNAETSRWGRQVCYWAADSRVAWHCFWFGLLGAAAITRIVVNVPIAAPAAVDRRPSRGSRITRPVRTHARHRTHSAHSRLQASAGHRLRTRATPREQAETVATIPASATALATITKRASPVRRREPPVPTTVTAVKITRSRNTVRAGVWIAPKPRALRPRFPAVRSMLQSYFVA
jgi:hypothetical protein